MSAIPTPPTAELGGGLQTDTHAGLAAAHSRQAARPAADDRPGGDLAYLAEAAAAVAAVRTASDLGVFAMLESVPAHSADVAEQLALNPRGTSQLLEALACLGLLAVTPDGYVPTVARSVRAAAAAHMWDALPEMVRTGTGPHHVDTTVGAEAMYQDVVGFLSDLTGPVAEAVAKHLVDEAVPADVLEVGSGAAPWSRAVARQAPSAHITALDLPSILPITQQQVEDDGLDRQFSYLPADAFTVDPDNTAYDLILLPNICHLFDASANQALLRRLAPSLRPDGRMAIIDVLPGKTPGLARSVSLYALGLMIRTDTGGVHGEAEYRDWLEAAGLGGVMRWDVTHEAPVAVVIGRA